MKNPNRTFFLALFTLATILIYASPAHAVLDRCPRHKISTEVKAKRMKTKFQRGTLRGINDYLNSHSVLAFVQNPISVQAEYNFRIQEIGNNKACVMLDDVRVYYLSAPRVVMPKNFRKKSCEYKIILQHEQRHLDVHYKYYDRSVKQYAAFLGRIARSVPISVPVSNKEEAAEMENHIREYFTKEFATQVNKSLMEMQALQSKIDSPQEYTFTGKKIDRCNEREEREKRQNKKTFYDPNE